jgi:hypothetical protein
MASNPMMYNIDNESLNISNIINYLYYLNYHKIIPAFTFNFDNEIKETMTITVIYSMSSTNLPLSGFTTITYNIQTQKWKSSINLSSIIDGRLIDKTFTNIQRDFPFVIDNNLLKINYQYPYVEYVIESYYIEDVLEPSLNKFINVFNSYNIDPYNIITDPIINNNMSIVLQSLYMPSKHFGNYNDFVIFNTNNRNHKRYLEFLLKKYIINDRIFVPEELWKIIYKYFYRNT